MSSQRASSASVSSSTPTMSSKPLRTSSSSAAPAAEISNASAMRRGAVCPAVRRSTRMAAPQIRVPTVIATSRLALNGSNGGHGSSAARMVNSP